MRRSQGAPWVPMLCSLMWLGCSAPPTPAELVLRGGSVRTLEQTAPWVQALAVRDGVIVALGTDSDVGRFVGDETSVVELDGRLVLPGFIDAAVDLEAGGRALEGAPLGEASSYDELLALVRVHAAAHPDRTWVEGVGWRDPLLGNGRRSLPADLHEAVSGRPALLISQDGRAGWASTRALELAGVEAPFGILHDEALDSVKGLLPQPSPSEHRQRLASALAYLRRFGITSAHESPPRAEGVIPIRPFQASPDWGRRRTRPSGSFPVKSLGAGGLLVFGSRWPFGPLDPLLGIHAVVTRQDLDGNPEGGWEPEERLSVEEAVAAYTLNGARAFSEDRVRGSLAVGKVADLVVLSENIFEIPPRRIAECKVEMTALEGEVVFLSRGFLTDEERRKLLERPAVELDELRSYIRLEKKKPR